ncbi:hypothetical protein ACR6HW_11845 [Fusibacter sp. JL298sf-3]
MEKIITSFFSGLIQYDKKCIEYWDPLSREMFRTSFEIFKEKNSNCRKVNILKKITLSSLTFLIVEQMYSDSHKPKEKKTYTIVSKNNKFYFCYLSNYLENLISFDNLNEYEINKVKVFSENVSRNELEIQEHVHTALDSISTYFILSNNGFTNLRLYWLNKTHVIYKLLKRSFFVDAKTKCIFCFNDNIDSQQLAHEIIHSIYATKANHLVHVLFREGIAEAFFERKYYIERIKDINNLKFDIIESIQFDQSFDEETAIIYGLFCRYIIEKYNVGKFDEAYSMNSNNLEYIFSKVYKCDFATIVDEFNTWTKFSFRSWSYNEENIDC